MEAKQLAEKLSTGKMAWRPNKQDQELILKLHLKLGIKPSEILRQGLRRLAEVERVY
jgi:hypothetical protein